MTINASRTVKKVFSTFDSLLKSSPFKFNGIVVSYKKGDPFNLFEDEVTNKLVRDSFKCNTAHLLFPSSLPPIVLACNDGTSESVRNISSMAIKQLKSLIVSEKMMEENNILGVLETSERKNNIKALSEGCNLGLYDIKTKISSHSPLFDPAKQRNTVSLQLLQGDDDQEYQWEVGRIFASCQNISRYLMDMPSNMMTPSIFAYEAKKYFGNRKNTILKVFGKEWAKEQKMGAFLGVSAGSEEPLKFVEIHYKGKVEADDVDVSLVGKGITFDSGGISIKPSAGMGSMKGDMGGAACVFGVMNGIIELGLKVNVSAFIPLAENMPSGKAVKPGDVVFACNGKSIEVENTDAEGRLILADALAYCSKEFNPKAIIDIATLTGAIDVALGSYASGLFCNNNHFASQIIHAGIQEDDVFWRMPLSKMYSNSIKSKVADLSNIGEKGAGACTAAAFLHEFVGNELKGIETMPSDLNDSSRSIKWAHIDMAGVMTDKSKMMSGRPVRALVSYFLNKQ